MSRTVITRGVLAFAMLALVARPTLAQGQNQRGYVVGLGGAGMTTEVTSPFFGGSLGWEISRNVLISVDAGRTQNVEAKFTREDLAAADLEATADTGLRVVSSVKMPTNFLSGGVRVRLLADRKVVPYVLAQGGIAHMSTSPKFLVQGLDATAAAMEDPTINAAFKETTRPMAALGGGLTMQVSDHVIMDLGYRYSGIFIKKTFLQDPEEPRHQHNRIDTHRVYAGIGLTF